MLREMVLFPAMIGGLLTVTSIPAPATEPVMEPAMGSATGQALAFCAERAALVKSLSDTYSEVPAAVGQIDGNAVIEVLVSESGSWTILATGTDGRSCVVSGGEGWELTRGAIGVGA